MTTNPQHVIRLEVHDTLRLKAFSIKPNGEPIVIGGNNNQGKSSALQVIKMLMAGAKEIPDQPVRKGAKKAQAVLETEDYTVTRTLTTDGKRQVFKVTGKNGADVARPQGFLDSWRGKTAFDPLEFARADKHKRLAAMKQIAGVDTEEIDGKISGLESKRTEIGRDVKRLRGAVESIEVPDDVPEAIDTSEVQHSLEQAREHNAKISAKSTEREALREQRDRLTSEIVERQTKLDEINKQGQAAKKYLEAAKPLDEQPLIDKLTSAAEVASLRAKADERGRVEIDLDGALGDAEQVAQDLEKSREYRRKMIAGATFPVEGLGFGVDDVEYEGLPFDQAGGGARLRISVAVSLIEAQKSQLRVMLIDGAEELDEANLAMVLEMASAAGVQPIIARRSLGDECTVILEDGEVKA